MQTQPPAATNVLLAAYSKLLDLGAKRKEVIDLMFVNLVSATPLITELLCS